MRINKPILFVLTFLLTFNSNAAEMVLEPQAMLYYRVPLGGGHDKQMQPSFGFRLDRTLHEKGKPVDYRQLFRQHAVLDFKMDRSGVESLTIAGVDYLRQYRMFKAAEDEAESAADSAGTEAAPAAEESVTPAEEVAAEEAPAEETPVEEAVDEETTAAETPAEETATEEAAAEETPVEEVAAEEATAEEVPAEEEPGFFEGFPEIFEENQRYGLIIGAVIGIGIVAGSFTGD